MKISSRAGVRALVACMLALCAGAADSDINLSMGVQPDLARPGQQVLVQITASNSGTAAELNARVRMKYPQGMAPLSEGLVTGPLDDEASCAGVFSSSSCEAGEMLEWDLGVLAPGQAVSFSLPPSVSSASVAGTLITWEASLADDGGAVARASATLTVDRDPALTVAIDEASDPVAAGGTLGYTVRYGNRSASSVSGTQLRLRLPAGTSFDSATGGGTLTGGTEVSWDLGTLPAGAVAQQRLTVVVDGGLPDGTLLESEASIGGVHDGLATESRVTETAYVGPETPLVLALGVAPLPARPGEPVQVDMTVSNPTGGSVFGGVVRMRYPQGMAPLSEGLVTGPLDDEASCAGVFSSSSCEAGEMLEWDLGGVLAPGQAVDLSLSAALLDSIARGELVSWSVQVSDDSGSLRRARETLLVGEALVTIPAVAGLAPGAAEDALTALGLTVGTAGAESSRTIPVGDVVGARPGSGSRVSLGSVVALVISLGPPVVEGPDLTGLSRGDAEAAILDAGLKVGTITTAPSTAVAAGHVISQGPRAGVKVVEGSRVSLVISSGPVPLVTVPDLVGLSGSAFVRRIILTGAGLRSGNVSTVPSDIVAEGIVIRQRPRAGSRVRQGSVVRLTVSSGPALIPVPDLVGLSQADAVAALAAAGLDVGTVGMVHSAIVPAGLVAGQMPTSFGSDVPAGTAVDLVLSLGVTSMP